METDAATRRYRLWLRGLRSLRGELRSARWSNYPAQLAALVGCFLDPVVTLCAPWATAAERSAAYWLAGWRSTTLVHLLYTESGRRLEAQLPDLLLGVRWPGNLGDLGPAQLARVDALQRRAVAEEDALSREMARVQEDRGGVVTAGPEVALDMGALVARLGAVLRGADALRLRTMRQAVEILQPAQAVELLIAAADLEIGLHEFGLKYGGRDE
ncbi:hypothetical protein SEVIR_7G166800v4 [Setaria viridis]